MLPLLAGANKEAVELKMGASTVQALFRPHEGPIKRGLLILFPDNHTHMDWPNVMRPLAKGLNTKGWASVSMNLMHPEAKPLDELANQLQQRIKPQDYAYWVLIGYGSGSQLAQAFYLAGPKLPIRALVLISANLREYDAKTHNLALLDIVASGDIKALIEIGKQRRQWSLNKQLRRYQQRMVVGADHQYTGLQDELVTMVRSWLHKQFQLREKK